MFNVLYDDEKVEKLCDLFAKFTYDDNLLDHCVKLEYWVSSGDRGSRHRYQEIWYNYVVRTAVGLLNKAPFYARISTNKMCNNLSDYIPIQNDKPQRTYTYGVCLHQSLYGYTNPQILIDWVELNLALGFEIMTIYMQNVSDEFHTAMMPYINTGVVEVLEWGLKPPLIPGYTKCWGQTALITECHYRNLYRVKYLALYDIDEFFVPQHGGGTIKNLIETIEKNPKVVKSASYVIFNAFFYKKGPPLPELNTAKKCLNMNWPYYYVFTIRSDHPSRQHHYHKMIIKPQAAISAWIHWLNKWQKGYTKEYHVPESDALVHHYRVPEKKQLTKGRVQTFLMSRYFNQTFHGIMKQIC